MRLIVALAIVMATATIAGAYPQFQLSQEPTCGACHLSPSGGGLLNDFGRDEAGSTISRGGDGRLLHGLWDAPEWFAVGGDFRFATGGRQVAGGAGEPLIFPMQADVNTRLMVGDFAFAFTAGLRGVARDEKAPVYLERLASREHYLAYTHDTAQLRVGRFFPVFGLRVPDHTSYVRRFMGFNLYEEPYAAEVAFYEDETQLHLTAFVPQPIDLLGSGARRSGASLQLEHNLGETLIVGGQARGAKGPEDAVFTVGGTAKKWFAGPGVLLLGELDVQRQTFLGHGPGRTQVAGYLGATKWITRGVLVGSAAHMWEPDLTLRATTRQAFDVTAQYFPWAHVELHLLLRGSAQGGFADEPNFLGLLQVHYYL